LIFFTTILCPSIFIMLTGVSFGMKSPSDTTSFATDPAAGATAADSAGGQSSSPVDTAAPAIDQAGQGSSGAPSPDQGASGNPDSPAKRPTLPAKAKGKPPADPGAKVGGSATDV
jgi:hypothetical protein